MVAEFVTVRSKNLSIWQSMVDEVSRRPDVDPETGMLMREAAAVHVRAAMKGIDVPSMNAQPRSVEHWAFLSRVHYEHVEAARLAGATTVTSPAWKYSNDDPLWFECEVEYLAYYTTHLHPVYHDWQKQGGNNLDYGVIPYTLPNDAKVLVIGDWGTGQNDAASLLTIAIKTLKPDAIIHLGDVYYSGTENEAKKHVVDVFQNAFYTLDIPPIPVFTMCGNHDYYSGGQGFYNTIAEINKNMTPNASQYLQQASYFCLRTTDNSWQFLAMDTGWDDRNPMVDGTQIDMVGPKLQDSEVAWHQDKLNKFPGYTLLLSHHQLFSANAKINSPKKDLAYVNKFLIQTFEPYFFTIGAWIWGHEHNFAAYTNGTLELAMARLIGNSAYEETLGDGPYTINYPAIPYAGNMVKVGASPYGTPTDAKNTYYNHSVALIDFARAVASAPLKISYYQFPSWPDNAPPPGAPETLSFMYTEEIAPPPPVLEWSADTHVKITKDKKDDSPKTNDAPALAVYNGTLYMAYKGDGNSLYYSWYDGSSWTGNERLKVGKKTLDSNHSPALAVYNNRLYMIYKGSTSNTLYYAWFDGSSWSGNDKIEISKKEKPQTQKGPTAAVFGKYLYIAYRSTSDDVCYSWYDGSKWYGDNQILEARTDEAPTLAVYTVGGSAVLYAAYRGKKNEDIYISQLASPGSTSWSGNKTIGVYDSGTPASPYGVGLAQIGQALVMLYAGKSKYIYWAKLAGGVWTGNLRLEDTTPITGKSDKKIGATAYRDGLFMTYKKDSNHEIWQAKMSWKGKTLVS